MSGPREFPTGARVGTWIGPVAMVVGLPLLLAAWIPPNGGPGSRG